MRDTDELKNFLQSTDPMLLILGTTGGRKIPLLTQAISFSSPNQMVLRLKGRSNLQPSVLTELLSKHWAVQFDGITTGNLNDALNRIIDCLRARKETCLLLVEQAHLLPTSILDALCHLSQQQANKSVTIRIILAGYQELISKINMLSLKKFEKPREIYLRNNTHKKKFQKKIMAPIMLALCLSGFLWWKTQGSRVLFHATPNTIANHSRIHLV